jgi:hypothetical protein
VNQRQIPGLDPAVQERAGLTDAQAEALALWDPSPSGRGYRAVALALDLSREAVRDRVRGG